MVCGPVLGRRVTHKCDLTLESRVNQLKAVLHIGAIVAVIVGGSAATVYYTTQLLELAVPGRHWECPVGTQTYLRATGGELGFYCFRPEDAQHQ